ncbi:hypothetical protein ACI1UM_10660 [Lactococcus petauri]
MERTRENRHIRQRRNEAPRPNQTRPRQHVERTQAQRLERLAELLAT